MTKHLGFTGTRSELTEIQRLSLWNILVVYSDDGFTTMHNGGAIGADYLAGTMWQDKIDGLRSIVELHPALIRSSERSQLVGDINHLAKPPLDRNKDIVNSSVALVACPQYMHEQQRSGTWSTIRYAAKKKLELSIVWPDGTITKDW